MSMTGELINRLEDIKDMGIVNHAKDTETIQMAITVIRALSEKTGNTGWIPCNERYPENDNYILLSFQNFDTPVVGRYKEDEDGGAFYIGDEDETCISQDMIVNGWQPLPEPYKEAEQVE